ncbi:hypothetical protein BJY01DRAFT_246662 [Aspergillus pseudoustus]|uniref:NAD(P)-binding protein n=1 Tax=Aspergillus pseudoustus TaxID=1810923 RepID=A0ABR4K620_9EURO
MTSNLMAGVLLAKGVFADIQAQDQGRIVFVSSIAAYGAGSIERLPFRCIKKPDYIVRLMRSLVFHGTKHDITVNDVAPAIIGSTGMLPEASGSPGSMESIPLGRPCTPNKVTNAMQLCDDGAHDRTEFGWHIAKGKDN